MRFLYAIAPAIILGPLPKMVHKIVFTWKFYVFTLMELLGKKVPPTCLHVLPLSRTFKTISIAKLVCFVRFIYALAPASTLGPTTQSAPNS